MSAQASVLLNQNGPAYLAHPGTHPDAHPTPAIVARAQGSPLAPVGGEVGAEKWNHGMKNGVKSTPSFRRVGTQVKLVEVRRAEHEVEMGK